MIKPGSPAKRRWVIPVLILLATGVLFYTGYRRRVSEKEDRVLLEIKPIETGGGWGYLIFMNHQVYIRQTIIPAISGTHPFRTREDALAVGQKVVDRMTAGQMPMVTAAEVHAMGIYPDTLTKR
jgi:hypothetical protein